jgi:hypothetical protein
MWARAVAVVVQAGLFAGFAACNYHVARWSAARQDGDGTSTCMGSPGASRRIVYLHGLDSRAPSWQELDIRRALAAIPDAAIAVPRAPTCGPGRCWPDADDGTDETIAAVRDAARACFGDGESYGVVGFSRGGFALARLDGCGAVGARWAIVASAFGYTEELRLRDCPVATVVGRGDRHHHDGAVAYALRRRTAGLRGPLIEFDGGHRVDARALASAVDALEREAGGR